jgi:hypothetical protein
MLTYSATFSLLCIELLIYSKLDTWFRNVCTAITLTPFTWASRRRPLTDLVHGLSVSDHNLGRFLSRGLTPSPYNPDPFLTHCKLWCNVSRNFQDLACKHSPQIANVRHSFLACGPLTLTPLPPPFPCHPSSPTQSQAALGREATLHHQG